MASNIQIAREEAARCDTEEMFSDHYCYPFGRKPDALFGEDSDYASQVWFVGGNSVIVRYTCDGYEAMRRHDLIRYTRELQYPFR